MIYSEEVGMDSAIGDFDPLTPVPNCPRHRDGSCVWLYLRRPHSGKWDIKTIWDDSENAGWVVKIADVLPETTATN